ncbi:dihydroflavonol-4-reductase [Litorimonas taeanensis]|uniref:Dihydroflavonol-4-reductase n=1 Tax=Litorimonas taeanensis TaxID=568099 RepID=A0A420WJG4_9PROT|nr:SDR family NAD(P)-dependent oxidoreductase [Litorimonas taeanensis]RKQ71171.1 dihydroflavonol-4-reductase [Litorimonas taeanensis]
MTKTVLLTGVSGYIGLHVAKLLLEDGYHVRGSIRSKSKEKHVRDTLHAASVDTSKLTFVELDLSKDEGWDEAANGSDFVVHVASPFTVANPKSEAEMINPAVEGTLRALHAAEKAKIKRVVLTSSLVSMMGSMKSGTVTPSHWTDINAKDVSTYIKSKTLAEKAAWDFVNSQASTNQMELVVINPGAVYGPPLGDNLTGASMGFIDQMLKGKLPMVPRLAMPMVDVRDVAKLHVLAMTHDGASGQRIIASDSKPHGFADVAQVLKDEGYEGPSTRFAPNLIIRLSALFDREAKGMLSFLGMNVSADNSRTQQLFDWTPISFNKMIADTGAAVKAHQTS